MTVKRFSQKQENTKLVYEKTSYLKDNGQEVGVKKEESLFYSK